LRANGECKHGFVLISAIDVLHNLHGGFARTSVSTRLKTIKRRTSSFWSG
jgi:hypothetical protein